MRTTVLCLILICLISLSVPAQEPLDNSSATAIRALEHAWVEGDSRNDNRALDLIFDNSLVYIEYGETMTKGEYLGRIRTAGPHPPQIALEAMSVRIFEDSAIVVGTYRERNAKSGKIMEKRWRFVDTWINKKNGWMLVAAAASPCRDE